MISRQTARYLSSTRWMALWLLLLLLVAGIAASRPRELVEGVWTVDVAACSLDYHQGKGALILACPGVDQIRLWPWPPAWPWYEEPLESPPAPPADQQAGTARWWMELVQI